MKQPLLFILFEFLLSYSAIKSQVYIKLSGIPANTTENCRLYIAGNFNGWNPGDKNYELKRGSDNLYVLQFATGLKEIEFKVTLGSWDLEECDKNGGTIQNRRYKVKGNDTLLVLVEAWKNRIKKHTASPNVSVINENFYIPQLERTRRIWIYLPPDYQTSTRSFPVFYAHDGQNLFDAATSFAEEWGIDETLDSLFKSGMKVPIVVGIDNGGKDRIDELTPWPNEKYGGGSAEKYCEFIVETLKPYIDSTYRTLPERQNTGLFGSSLGGLVTFYMTLKYPDIFGKSMIFSPSFWFSDKIYEMAEKSVINKNFKMFLSAGAMESESLEKEILKMKEILENKGMDNKTLKVEIIPEGKHSEWFWRNEFPKAILWLYNLEFN